MAEADAGLAFDDLLAELRATVIANLRRLPRRGRRDLANSPQSAEALAQLAAMPAQNTAGAPDALRENLRGDYLMPYMMVDGFVQANAGYMLSIRHHRQRSFDVAGLWPGASPPGQR